MAQQVKALAAKSNDLSLSPRTYMVERKKWLQQVIPWLPETHGLGAYVYTHTYTHTMGKPIVKNVYQN